MKWAARGLAVGGWVLAAVVVVERYSGPSSLDAVVSPTVTVVRPAPVVASPGAPPGRPAAPERPLQPLRSASRGPSRYLEPGFASGPSKVECYRFGRRVDEREPERCHAGPPFWNWWLEFRNCVATNACLFRGVLTLYSGGESPEHRLPPPEVGDEGLPLPPPLSLHLPHDPVTV